jgi:hypothetical protein
MIRFILKHENRYGGYVSDDLETLDVDCPELEKVLTRGGYGGGPDGGDFDRTRLIGAEVRPGAAPSSREKDGQ